ncbi:NAD(P)-dependent oxidoreductase [Nonomuraea thailandensis]
MTQTAGWIGTGRMGYAMAERLALAGVDLAVWNRTRARAEPLREHGAQVVGTVAALRDRDVVFSTVAASGDLTEVLDGLLAGGPGPGVVVDCSTVSAEASAAARAACARHGTGFLAAPVSGNAKVVRAGLLSFVCSGPRETYDRVSGLLARLGRSATYAGRARPPAW